MKSPFFKAIFIISILISLNDEWFECFSCNNWHTNLVIKKLIEFNGARFLKYFKTCHYCAFTFMKKKAGSWFTRIHLKRSTCTPLSLLISLKLFIIIIYLQWYLVWTEILILVKTACVPIQYLIVWNWLQTVYKKQTQPPLSVWHYADAKYSSLEQQTHSACYFSVQFKIFEITW